jgi:serine/threonine protein kinase
MSSAGFEQDTLKPLLGTGAFSKVFRVTERSTRKGFAVKVMERPFFEVRGIGHLIEREIGALRRCTEQGKSRHIVKLLDTAEEAGRVFLRLELCDFSIYEFAQGRPGGRITEGEVAPWAAQLLAGLEDLHSIGILHRDIKPSNLLYSPDGSLKITDFGWCADSADAPTDLAGTFQYMAPEVMEQVRPQTEVVDVWSAGATLLELLVGRPMLASAPEMGPKGPMFKALLHEVAERCPPSQDSKPSSLSHTCWSLLRSMLIPDVAIRASVQVAQHHPWLKEHHNAPKAAPARVRSPVRMRSTPSTLSKPAACRDTGHVRAASNSSTATPHSSTGQATPQSSTPPASSPASEVPSKTAATPTVPMAPMISQAGTGGYRGNLRPIVGAHSIFRMAPNPPGMAAGQWAGVPAVSRQLIAA